MLPLATLCLADDLHQPFGVSYAGASFKFTILDKSGRKAVTQGWSSPFAAYLGDQA